jgi:hypothetical protein
MIKTELPNLLLDEDAMEEMKKDKTLPKHIKPIFVGAYHNYPITVSEFTDRGTKIMVINSYQENHIILDENAILELAKFFNFTSFGLDKEFVEVEKNVILEVLTITEMLESEIKEILQFSNLED